MMNNNNINKNMTTTFGKNSEKSHGNSIADATTTASTTATSRFTARCEQVSQPPRPEPLRKQHQIIIAEQENTITQNERESLDQQVVKLVNVSRDQQQKISNLNQVIYPGLQNKRTSFNEAPVESVADEGVSSPTNIDYEDEEEITDDYYEDEDEYDASEQADELTNLSRQSMMPLHELIAYYQYIQQGNNPHVHREAVSRQSSSSSQKTARTKRSVNGDSTESDSLVTAKCVVIQDDDVQSTEQKDLITTNESCLNEVQVPQVFVDEVDATNDSKIDGLPVKPPQMKDKRRIRANVVLELINSERDFVKHLKDVVDGYLHPARRHPEIFTGERINTIFSNIEQLYEFQKKFLERLETCIEWDDLAESQVGQCFLEYENGFAIYHYYCNNHPNATSELQDLYTKPRFVKFFEACRLLQNMIDISLDGFLLTPIQKICKYPLQLNELLKNTDEEHPDYNAVANALNSMRNCANLANERKRRIEALADVMSFQEKVDNWFGPKLSDTSSILIHSGEVSKMTSHTWSQGVQLYLFDHLLLYSKKDLLKRNTLILKGRVCMDTVTEISDADEYKPKKSFKLFCSEQQKWFVFTTRSEKERDEWITAFERERNLVEADENEGFRITEREVGIARRALQNRKHSRSARYRHKRPDTAIVDQLDIDDANLIMNRTLSLPSCIHPSHVMNFVEDSKVVSGRKKNISPNSSMRSPNTSSQYLTEQENQQQSSGSWFRKMGSKKFAKSQVYNVNGAGSGQSVKPSAVSPTGGIFLADKTSLGTSTTTNYDQLEKRYRDHMVSEEQARLFRLNNDLPPPIFGSPITKLPIALHSNNRRIEPIPPRRFQQHPSPQLHQPQLITRRKQSLDAGHTVANLSQDGHTRPNQAQPVSPKAAESTGTFETTVVLSSGRVVRVREDAV